MALPQLLLNFLDLPVPETCVWEQLPDRQRALAVETLTRLIAKAALGHHDDKENEHD